MFAFRPPRFLIIRMTFPLRVRSNYNSRVYPTQYLQETIIVITPNVFNGGPIWRGNTVYMKIGYRRSRCK